MITIKATWESYRNVVLPDGISPKELAKSKADFYAGAASMFGKMTAVGRDQVCEDHAVSLIQGYQDEIEEYITTGKAANG